jgi:sporulation protein YlmC with PRC-barrel domain
MDTMKHRRLQELDRSDFEIVNGEPDIRGWDVRNNAGQKIGEVEDLIVDAQQKKVRYMVVDLDDNELKLDHRKVLIPIGLAELHQKDDDVILPNVQAEHFRSLPDYDKNDLTPDVETRICTAFGRTNTGVTNVTSNTEEHQGEFYKHDYFNDDNLYKHRLHEAQPVSKESEYERGLRLWEKRSEGGIIPDNSREQYREREIEENARMEMVRNRRNAYEQRRGGSGRDNYRRRDNSIEGRIRDEGLQDA